MATAAQAAPVGAAPKSRKKLLIILMIVALLALAGGGAMLYVIKAQQATEYDDDDDDEPKARAQTQRRDLSVKPVYVSLDLFTVNLADRDADRYAQITMYLEVENEKSAEQLKNFTPLIRNSILMALSYKTSAELLERDGKAKLAVELRREISRALGLQVPEDPPPRGSAARRAADDEEPPRRRRLKPEEITPVKAVHFSNFIIQ